MRLIETGGQFGDVVLQRPDQRRIVRAHADSEFAAAVRHANIHALVVAPRNLEPNVAHRSRVSARRGSLVDIGRPHLRGLIERVGGVGSWSGDLFGSPGGGRQRLILGLLCTFSGLFGPALHNPVRRRLRLNRVALRSWLAWDAGARILEMAGRWRELW
jgi:hypothetical protein